MAESLQVNHPEVIFEDFGDEVVVINLASGVYYSLVKMGADVWNLMARGLAVGEIIERISQRYLGSQGQVEQAVRQLVGDLQQEQLVVAGSQVAGERPASIPEPAEGKLAFEFPTLHKFTDLRDLGLMASMVPGPPTV